MVFLPFFCANHLGIECVKPPIQSNLSSLHAGQILLLLILNRIIKIKMIYNHIRLCLGLSDIEFNKMVSEKCLIEQK